MIKTKFSSLNLEHGFKMSILPKYALTFGIAFLSFLLISQFNTVRAENSEVIVILDLGIVLSKSTAMADVDRQLKQMDADIRSEGAAREKKLREEQDEINRQRVILPPETFNKKLKAFGKKASGYKNEMQAKLKQLAFTRSSAINRIEKAMEPIVSNIAKSVNATMILEKKKILFAGKELDISEMVVTELNKKMSSIQLKLLPLPTK